MPLIQSGSRKAVSQNIKTEMAHGKPQKQAIAIAFDVARRARRADGGRTKKDDSDGLDAAIRVADAIMPFSGSARALLRSAEILIPTPISNSRGCCRGRHGRDHGQWRGISRDHPNREEDRGDGESGGGPRPRRSPAWSRRGGHRKASKPVALATLDDIHDRIDRHFYETQIGVAFRQRVVAVPQHSQLQTACDFQASPLVMGDQYIVDIL